MVLGLADGPATGGVEQCVFRVPYALIVAVAYAGVLGCFASASRKCRRPNKTTALIFLLMLWISSPPSWHRATAEIYEKWELAEKMLLMTLLAYTLTNSRERASIN